MVMMMIFIITMMITIMKKIIFVMQFRVERFK